MREGIHAVIEALDGLCIPAAGVNDAQRLRNHVSAAKRFTDRIQGGIDGSRHRRQLGMQVVVLNQGSDLREEIRHCIPHLLQLVIELCHRLIPIILNLRCLRILRGRHVLHEISQKLLPICHLNDGGILSSDLSGVLAKRGERMRRVGYLPLVYWLHGEVL